MSSHLTEDVFEFWIKGLYLTLKRRITMKTIKFKSWNCKIVRKFYANDRPALELIDANDGSPILKATVNLPEYSLNEDEVFIKDWSENAGIYNVLVNEGIISEATEIVPTGFVHALKCKLLFKF